MGRSRRGSYGGWDSNRYSSAAFQLNPYELKKFDRPKLQLSDFDKYYQFQPLFSATSVNDQAPSVMSGLGAIFGKTTSPSDSVSTEELSTILVEANKGGSIQWDQVLTKRYFVGPAPQKPQMPAAPMAPPLPPAPKFEVPPPPPLSEQPRITPNVWQKLFPMLLRRANRSAKWNCAQRNRAATENWKRDGNPPSH